MLSLGLGLDFEFLLYFKFGTIGDFDISASCFSGGFYRTSLFKTAHY
jgi:hypothetical protein